MSSNSQTADSSNNNKDVNNADDDVWLRRNIFRRFNIFYSFGSRFETAYNTLYGCIYSRKTHTIFIVSSSVYVVCAFFFYFFIRLFILNMMSATMMSAQVLKYLMLRIPSIVGECS